MAETLDDLLKRSRERLAAMTPEERAKMYAAQRQGYAEAEAAWPKPLYRFEDGVKVYASYEDYCND